MFFTVYYLIIKVVTKGETPPKKIFLLRHSMRRPESDRIRAFFAAHYECGIKPHNSMQRFSTDWRNIFEVNWGECYPRSEHTDRGHPAPGPGLKPRLFFASISGA
jgi:hypothetical protein